MNSSAQEQVWLESYVHNYLWVDDEWLELGDQSCTYWQARLPPTTTVHALSSDGRAKWRVRTRIVNNVGNPDKAFELCFAINPYAAGWSFAYDAVNRSVDAVIAMCAPVQFD